MRALQGEMAAEGKRISICQLCRWLSVAHRTFYYKAKKRRRKFNAEVVAKVKETIEAHPSNGYRMIAAKLKMNRKVVQRILQLKGWQVNKRAKGHRPRARAMKSITANSNVRWATDLTSVWCGKDRWCTLALVIDCCDRELIGWRLARSGNAKTAEAALEEALIHRFGTLGRVTQPLALRSDNGLVFTSKLYTTTVKAYRIDQEFTTPYTPEQNGLIERFIRTLKEDCIWQQRFESLTQAQTAIGRWIRYYNTDRPHSALGYVSPRTFLKAA